MKILLLLLLLTTFSLSCFCQKPVSVDPTPPPIKLPKNKTIKYKPPKRTVDQLLRSYFLGREIEPYITVNNFKLGPYIPDGETEIPLGDHKVRWIKNYGNAAVEINGHLITLNDKVSLNPVDTKPSAMDKVDFTDDWDQAKLYQLEARELIGISTKSTPCTGNGCSVTFFLVYDLKNKTANFFGSYRVDPELKLFDFSNDGSIDFLAGTYFGGASIDSQKLFHFYSLNDKGEFVLQKDAQQRPYFINRFFTVKNYEDIEIDNKFTHNWIEQIK